MHEENEEPHGQRLLAIYRVLKPPHREALVSLRDGCSDEFLNADVVATLVRLRLVRRTASSHALTADGHAIAAWC